MTCTLRRISESELRRLRESPEQVSTFLLGDALPLETVRVPGVLGFIERLFGIKTEQVIPGAVVDEPIKPIEDRDEIDIDKAWDGLHFLFTGTSGEGHEPECFLLCGGEEIGTEEDGATRVLNPSQVSQFAAFLAGLSRDELARRYNPSRMVALEIYPKVIWTRPPVDGQSALDYLLEYYEQLRDFVTATSNRGDSLIVSVG